MLGVLLRSLGARLEVRPPRGSLLICQFGHLVAWLVDLPLGESSARGRLIASIGFKPDGIAIMRSAALAQ